MNPQTLPLEALATLAACLAGLATLGVCVGLVAGASMPHWLERYVERLEQDLGYLRAAVDGRRLAVAQGLLGGALILLALLGQSLLPLLAMLPLLVAPAAVIASRRDRRTADIEAQLDTWLRVLANGLRSNPALGDAIAASAQASPAPIAEELELCVREHRLGTPLDRALDHMGARIGSRTVEAAITALNVARRSGGDLSATLESAAASLREMARLEGVLRTKTAEGKSQATVVGLIPAPLIGVLELIDPTFLSPLWASARGHIVLAAAFTLWLLAVLWARSIVSVEL